MPALALRARRDGPPPRGRHLREAAGAPFADDLAAWRAHAADDWRELCGPPGTSPVSPVIPGYLLDRYAFRAFMRRRYGVRTADRFSRPLTPRAVDWEALTRTRLRGAPGVGIPPVRPDDQATDTPLVHDLLSRWRGHLADRGIRHDSGLFQPPAGRSWLDLYRDSVLYPFYPPAILGPTFMERVGVRQREEILASLGTRGIMGLYVFLLTSHEDTHRAQRGEPLLCEYLLAMVWCAFLDEHDQWYWQRNDDTGASLNAEEPFLRRVHLDSAALAALFHDTAAGSAQVLGPGAYDQLCLAAWLFDTRLIGYRDYLELATRRLCGQDTTLSLTGLLDQLDDRLTAVPHPGRAVGTTSGEGPIR